MGVSITSHCADWQQVCDYIFLNENHSTSFMEIVVLDPPLKLCYSAHNSVNKHCRWLFLTKSVESDRKYWIRYSWWHPSHSHSAKYPVNFIRWALYVKRHYTSIPKTPWLETNIGHKNNNAVTKRNTLLTENQSNKLNNCNNITQQQELISTNTDIWKTTSKSELSRIMVGVT